MMASGAPSTRFPGATRESTRWPWCPTTPSATTPTRSCRAPRRRGRRRRSRRGCPARSPSSPAGPAEKRAYHGVANRRPGGAGRPRSRRAPARAWRRAGTCVGPRSAEQPRGRGHACDRWQTSPVSRHARRSRGASSQRAALSRVSGSWRPEPRHLGRHRAGVERHAGAASHGLGHLVSEGPSRTRRLVPRPSVRPQEGGPSGVHRRCTGDEGLTGRREAERFDRVEHPSASSPSAERACPQRHAPKATTMPGPARLCCRGRVACTARALRPWRPDRRPPKWRPS